MLLPLIHIKLTIYNSNYTQEAMLTLCSLMEFQTIFKEDPSHPLSYNYLKHEPETEDVFPNQDLQQLNNFSLMGPSFHPDYGVPDSWYDPFSTFSYRSGSDDLELMPFELDNGCLTHVNKTFVGASDLDNFVHVLDPSLDHKPLCYNEPDEGSCVTGENGIKKNNGNPCKGKNKANSSKGPWTKEEDRILKQLVEKHGGRKWSHIAQMLKGRIGKHCRERWHNHLKPNINKEFWTEEEDSILITTHAQVGNRWSEIANKLPGRTENSIKNHWNATKRRQYTTRKCRSKWPKLQQGQFQCLILQNYIKSLNLPRGKSSTNKTKTDNSTIIQHKFYSSDGFIIPDFDFSELPEFALDENLLQESPFDHISPVNQGSDSDGDGRERKQIDLMEMISQVNS
ncbi:uncharacterized protein LOC143626442 [Bidens hawaiensis]|uniref:uncharacterized protein LOC143626442 n=1 Tax=Bidens hawaiensis TaxID=980011 RepID=UPI00404958A2